MAKCLAAARAIRNARGLAEIKTQLRQLLTQLQSILFAVQARDASATRYFSANAVASVTKAIKVAVAIIVAVALPVKKGSRLHMAMDHVCRNALFRPTLEEYVALSSDAARERPTPHCSLCACAILRSLASLTAYVDSNTNAPALVATVQSHGQTPQGSTRDGSHSLAPSPPARADAGRSEPQSSEKRASQSAQAQVLCANNGTGGDSAPVAQALAPTACEAMGAALETSGLQGATHTAVAVPLADNASSDQEALYVSPMFKSLNEVVAKSERGDVISSDALKDTAASVDRMITRTISLLATTTMQNVLMVELSMVHIALQLLLRTCSDDDVRAHFLPYVPCSLSDWRVERRPSRATCLTGRSYRYAWC